MERDLPYRGEDERAECERTLCEKIYRLSRDLNDPTLSRRQCALLRAELRGTLAKLEALNPRALKREMEKL